MLTKTSSTADIDWVLGSAAVAYKRRVARTDPRPANFRWIAETVEGQIASASEQERIDLYWTLAVVRWAAGQKGLARKAARVFLRLIPPSEIDLVRAEAREALRKALEAIKPPPGIVARKRDAWVGQVPGPRPRKRRGK